MLRLQTDQIAASPAAFVCKEPETGLAYASKNPPDLAQELAHRIPRAETVAS